MCKKNVASVKFMKTTAADNGNIQTWNTTIIDMRKQGRTGALLPNFFQNCGNDKQVLSSKCGNCFGNCQIRSNFDKIFFKN